MGMDKQTLNLSTVIIISQVEEYEAIRMLKHGKAAGPDETIGDSERTLLAVWLPFLLDIKINYFPLAHTFTNGLRLSYNLYIRKQPEQT